MLVMVHSVFSSRFGGIVLVSFRRGLLKSVACVFAFCSHSRVYIRWRKMYTLCGQDGPWNRCCGRKAHKAFSFLIPNLTESLSAE